jgi:hypothetical protein
MSAKKKSIIGLVVFIAIMSIALIATDMLRAGQLTPSAPPGPTMKTLDQIPGSWGQKIPNAADRFVLVLDGAGVLDRETGLVWLKSPDTVKRTWDDAMQACTTLSAGGRRGWRLPTVEELLSVQDFDVSTLIKLPAGHPFQNIQGCCYWTSEICTTYNSDKAWYVRMGEGAPGCTLKSDTTYGYMWPVRTGYAYGYQK